MSEQRRQCDPGTYRVDYDDQFRFISYFHQIKNIKQLGATRVLEIGVGNKTVSNYLMEHGISVITLDHDRRLKPQIAGDVRRLPLRMSSFDAVLCCEVLEHLPFENFMECLKEIHRVTRRHAVISVPYSCLRLAVSALLHVRLVGAVLRIPLFFLRMPAHGEHYWEMGRSLRYSKGRLRKAIGNSGFKILREGSPLLNPKHYFFVIEKRTG